MRQVPDYLLLDPGTLAPPPLLHCMRRRPLHRSAVIPSELLQRPNVYRGLSGPKVVPGQPVHNHRACPLCVQRLNDLFAL